MIIANWLYNSYTPSLCMKGDQNFGEDIHFDNFPDSMVKTGKKGEKMCITPSTEAYGLLQYENCQARWEASLHHQAAHPGATALKYVKSDSATHHLKAKWSDDGQGKGSGWNPEAYKVYEQRIEEVVEWREEEKKTGYKRWTVAQALGKSMEDDDETSES